MKLTRVRRLLQRRLAWLTAKAVDAPRTSEVTAEREALDTALRCLGMYDEQQLERDVEVVSTKVLPAVMRTSARARRADALHAHLDEFVAAARGAARCT